MSRPCPFYTVGMPCPNDATHEVTLPGGTKVGACDAHARMMAGAASSKAAIREPKYLSDDEAIEVVRHVGEK